VSILKAKATVGFALVVFMATFTPCAADVPREDQVKAAFIYNFTQFVAWPQDAFDGTDAPFVVAIVGDDPVSQAIEKAMAGKFVNTRRIVFRQFASADRIERCQILFVPASQQEAAPAILAKVKNAPVLTVGDGDAFMAQGGAIHLFVEEGRMRFELAPDVTDAARLKPSAKLMKLAWIYRK
jgi:hypothetical protein